MKMKFFQKYFVVNNICETKRFQANICFLTKPTPKKQKLHFRL